jgi:hypothetical protein
MGNGYSTPPVIAMTVYQTDCVATSAELRVVSARALAGRLEEAHTAIARLRQREPACRISDLEDRLSPFRTQDLARYLDGLRKAGLPE